MNGHLGTEALREPAGETRQLVLLEPGRLELRRVPPPTPAAGEVVVKVKGALTCGTDLKTYRRGHPKFPMPTPFGHEFSGDIWALGEGVEGFGLGQPVMVAPTAPCQACDLCRRGLGNLCELTMARMMLGAFAEYIRVPSHIVRQNMYPKPESLSYLEAAILEPLACVVYGARQLPLDPQDTVVILGAGPIGLLHLMLTRLRGVARIVVVGRRALRLEAARALGADVVIDEAREPAQAAVLEATGGRGADVVIECTGLPEIWELAVAMAGRGGRIMLYGGCARGTRARLPHDRIVEEELTVKGVFHFTPAAVRESHDLLCQGALPVGALITDVHPLSDFAHTFELLGRGEAIKFGLIPHL